MGFSAFDPADYLHSIEDVQGYLNAVLEDGTTSEIALALGTVARSQGMSRIARDAGLNRASLYTALSREGNPSFDTIQRVLRVLGLTLRVEPATKAAA